MKLNSSIFDSIRVKPSKDRRRKADQPRCEKPGCDNAATNKAPKNQGKENDYWHFCVEHAREFNHSYNFFKDMSLDEVAKYQKDAQTGHRPTWKMGERVSSGRKPGTGKSRRSTAPGGAHDPFGVFGEASAKGKEQPERTVHNAARKAFDHLGLDVDADKVAIKNKFKELVKRHHPDANGGDRSFEERLREIIVAYNYLKSAGYC